MVILWGGDVGLAFAGDGVGGGRFLEGAGLLFFFLEGGCRVVGAGLSSPGRSIARKMSTRVPAAMRARVSRTVARTPGSIASFFFLFVADCSWGRQLRIVSKGCEDASVSVRGVCNSKKRGSSTHGRFRSLDGRSTNPVR